MFDPKIGASLQREPAHAVNGWRTGGARCNIFPPLTGDFDNDGDDTVGY